MKRKVAHDMATKTSKTPKESLPKDEMQAQFSKENPAKGANRNSKLGQHGD